MKKHVIKILAILEMAEDAKERSERSAKDAARPNVVPEVIPYFMDYAMRYDAIKERLNRYAEKLIKDVAKQCSDERVRFDFIVDNKPVQIYSEKAAKRFALLFPDAVVKIYDCDCRDYIDEAVASDIFDVEPKQPK